MTDAVVLEFEGRVALVTGATSGIGQATARALATAGARLVITGRDQAALEAFTSQLGDDGFDAASIRADVTEAGAASRLVEFAVERYGRLDVLVNAAGIIGSGTVADTTDEQWSKMMRVNIDAPFRLIRAAVPELRRNRGSVVNVSSVTGVRAFPGILAYCVSKAAVDQLTRCAALELAADEVRVNAVNPGVVVSQLHRRGGMDDAAYAAFLEHSKTTHPMGRVGRPADIADAICYLAGPRSGWITGETLSVDGGRHQTCAR